MDGASGRRRNIEQHGNDDGNCCYTTEDTTSYGAAFELCPPIGIGVAEFEEEPWKTLLAEYDEELESGGRRI